MSRRREKTLDQIREHWTAAASDNRTDQTLRPTARDPYLQVVIEEGIERWLHKGGVLLDVGCGDGISTIRFANSVEEAVGVDYVDAYVSKARRNADVAGVRNVRFLSGDVLKLGKLRRELGVFDFVVTIRCLINLACWNNQAVALKEVADAVKPGGLCFVSEGWEDGMTGLNLQRQRVGLAPIIVVEYNTLISRSRFESEASKYFEIVDYIGAGFYLFMSRVFQPAFVKPDAPSHLHQVNKVASELQYAIGIGREFAECDYAGIYVLRKKC